MLTDQWYVRVAPMAKTAIEAVENGDIQFVRKTIREHVLQLDAWTFRTGVFPVNCGGATVFRPGMLPMAKFMLAAMKPKFAPKHGFR